MNNSDERLCDLCEINYLVSGVALSQHKLTQNLILKYPDDMKDRFHQWQVETYVVKCENKKHSDIEIDQNLVVVVLGLKIVKAKLVDKRQIQLDLAMRTRKPNKIPNKPEGPFNVWTAVTTLLSVTSNTIRKISLKIFSAAVDKGVNRKPTRFSQRNAVLTKA
ncbi:hypothetical protein CHS0354_008308 [Potamilus streckersoni]|uniref:Uncharacterized protein n=1 Tax=Potamilus streckersoni TaxID=2493646 RepID=A0AAE0VUA6_9BIVA|nr:hypothetical protein CHS0354_008308 [Potamilus streckersoni]